MCYAFNKIERNDKTLNGHASTEESKKKKKKYCSPTKCDRFSINVWVFFSFILSLFHILSLWFESFIRHATGMAPVIMWSSTNKNPNEILNEFLLVEMAECFFPYFNCVIRIFFSLSTSQPFICFLPSRFHVVRSFSCSLYLTRSVCALSISLNADQKKNRESSYQMAKTRCFSLHLQLGSCIFQFWYNKFCFLRNLHGERKRGVMKFHYY